MKDFEKLFDAACAALAYSDECPFKENKNACPLYDKGTYNFACAHHKRGVCVNKENWKEAFYDCN